MTRPWFEALEQVVEVASGPTSFRARLAPGTVGDGIALAHPDNRLRLSKDGRLVAGGSAWAGRQRTVTVRKSPEPPWPHTST